MSNLPLMFLGLAVLSLTIGFIGHNHPVIDGLGKALFGVFVIVFFIIRFFGEKNA